MPNKTNASPELIPYNPISSPDFVPFISGCGYCKPSTDYYQQQYGGIFSESDKIGNYSNDEHVLIPQSNGKNYFHERKFDLPLDEEFIDNNYGIDYKTAFGGKKAKKVKKDKKDKKDKKVKKIKHKGGNSFDEPSSHKMEYKTNNNNIELNQLMLKLDKKNISGGRNNKKPNQKLRGGTAQSGATPIDQRFFDPDAPIANAPALSGKGVMSAYGRIEPGDVGTGMLAPYTTSNCPYANPNTDIKTGGSKNKKPKQKLRGGTAQSGATPIDQRFFDPDAPIANAPALSGKGVMSAYGRIEPGDVGTGMLAPYTTSNCPYANPNTDIKTGGSKDKKSKDKKSKDKKGGFGIIPYVSSNTIDNVGSSVEGIISDFAGFLSTLDSDYVKSAKVVESIKIGNQRLIQGGKNSVTKSEKKSDKKDGKKEKMDIKLVKKSDKKDGKKEKMDIKLVKKSDKKDGKKEKIDIKLVKKSDKKDGKKEKMDIKLVKKSDKKDGKKKKVDKKGGFTGSDFALTLNSRGPSNAPDDYWGVPGEEWFRQFNKTGDYIPNSQLQYAATPLLSGKGDSDVVSGYSEPDLNYSFNYTY